MKPKIETPRTAQVWEQSYDPDHAVNGIPLDFAQKLETELVEMSDLMTHRMAQRDEAEHQVSILSEYQRRMEGSCHAGTATSQQIIIHQYTLRLQDLEARLAEANRQADMLQRYLNEAAQARNEWREMAKQLAENGGGLGIYNASKNYDAIQKYKSMAEPSNDPN